MTSENSILVRRVGSGQAWVEPDTDVYENEAHLQSLLACDPDRVPGVADGSVAVRELSTSGGPVDVCIVGPDGELTVVECKLASNSERRRMVIGQVIDYAAAIRYDGFDSFRNSWQRRDGVDLEDFLGGEGIDRLRSNVIAGRINLCLAVDQIDSDLRRMVEYVNLITRDEVMVTALQLAYVRHGDVEILIPTSFGGEIAAAKARSAGRNDQHWTRDSFVESLADPDDRARASELLERLDGLEHRGNREPLSFGLRPGGGLFFHLFGFRYPPFQLWMSKSGQLRVFGNWASFPSIAGHPGFSQLAALLGQDHNGSQKSVPVAELDLDQFWEIALAAAEAINS